MNYGSIHKYDIANGTGIRTSIFVSGCQHACKGCFNPEVWDFEYGNKYTNEVQEDLLNELDKAYIEGLSLLGGEPMHPRNQEDVLQLVIETKKRYPNKNIWCYTGFDFNDDILNKMVKFLPYTRKILENIDVIVDGKFIEDKKDLSLHFRGSSNQRIIDVQKSLKENKVVLYDRFVFDMRYEDMNLDNLYLNNLSDIDKMKIQYVLERRKKETEVASHKEAL